MLNERSFTSSLDVRTVMRGIRSRVRGQSREHEWAREARKLVPASLQVTVVRLQSHIVGLRRAIAAIGNLPPEPPTLRGRTGAALIRMVRRSLFWLLPQLRAVPSEIVDTVDEQLRLSNELLLILRQNSMEIARLREKVQRLEEAAARQDARPAA